MKSNMVGNASPITSVSGFKNSTVRPLLTTRPWLFPRVNPMFSSFANRVTQGKPAAMALALPSVEALSTTITSAV